MLLRRRLGVFFIFVLLLLGGSLKAEDTPDPDNYRNPYLARFFKLDSMDGSRLYQKLFMPFEPGQEDTVMTLPPAFYRPQEYEFNPAFVNGTLWTVPTDIKVKDGIYAYVSFIMGLGIFDIYDPTHPRLLSLNNFETSILNLQLYNDTLLFVTAWGEGGGYALYIMDVSRPNNPRLVSKYGKGFHGWNVIYDGWHGYLCAGDSGLQVLNLAQLGDPVLSSSYHLNDAYNMVKRNDTGYVVDFGIGGTSTSLTIFNLKDYTQGPIRIGSIGTKNQPRAVDVRGRYAYVADWNGHIDKGDLMVVDISNPATPVCVNYFQGFIGYHGPYDLQIYDSIMCMSTFYGNTAVLNLSDSVNPVVLGYIMSPKYGATTGLDLQWPYCYTADYGRGMQVGDISNPENPQFLGGFSFFADNSISIFDLTTMMVRGNYAYVFVQGPGLVSLDVTDPTKPIVLDYDNITQDVYAFDIDGNYAYKASQDFRIQITDISNPRDLKPIPDFYMPGKANDIVTRENLAYVADDSAGLKILDISDPRNIHIVGHYNDIYFGGQEAMSIDIEDTLACIGDFSGMQVVNIKDPTHPVGLGRFTDQEYITDIKVRNRIAYLATETLGVTAIDFSDPNHPYLLSFFRSICDEPFKIRLQGKYALIGNTGCNGREIKVLDISDPADIKLASEINSNGNMGLDAAIVGSRYIYSLDYRGLAIFDAGKTLYTCGDVNLDNRANILDISNLIKYLFRHDSMADPGSGDVNSSGKIDLIDITYLIDYIYRNGPRPVCQN
ncbi:exported hypothetical protein [Candidatus Zixiibacteriota bacterium]|nr:exported hypothetical protein [candidate division Zixibacteria bacterium]